MMDLDEAMNFARNSVELTPRNDPSWAGHARSLGKQLWKRYDKTGALADLDEAAQVLREALETTPQDSPEYIMLLTGLGVVLESRYGETRAVTDLEESIRLGREAISKAPEDRPIPAYLFGYLANRLIQRNERKEAGSMADSEIEEAIRVARQAVDASRTETAPDGPRWLAVLAVALCGRFRKTGVVTDIDDSIRLGREAVSIASEDYETSVLTTCLDHLWSCLREKYLRTEEADLEESIRIAQQAVDVTPEGYPGKAARLHKLAISLQARSLRNGSLADVNKSIELAREGLDLSSPGDFSYTLLLETLADGLEQKYSKSGSSEDLDEGIQFARYALDIISQDHPTRKSWLNHLADGLEERYSKTRVVEDLEEAIRLRQEGVKMAPQNDDMFRADCAEMLAIKLQERALITGDSTTADLNEIFGLLQEALDLTPKDHYLWFGRLANLGVWYGRLASEGVGLADYLERSIQLLRQAIDTAPDAHEGRPVWLNNLAGKLMDRYTRTGEISVLEQAIQVIQESIDSTSEDHPTRVKQLSILGVGLRMRYSTTGAMVDLERSLEIARETLKKAPEYKTDPFRLTRLEELADVLGLRHTRTGSIADLKEAIQIGREAVLATPEANSNRVRFMSNLARELLSLYSEVGKVSDLEESIHFAREATRMTPVNDADRPRRLNILASGLLLLHVREGDISNLEEMIQIARESLSRELRYGPNSANWLRILGYGLRERYRVKEESSDLEEAISCFQSSLCSPSSTTSTRIESGIQVLKSCATTSNWKQAYEAANMAVSLVPKLALRSLSNSDKQYLLGQIVGLACDAAAVALHSGEEPLVALGLLEQGRGILAASVEEIRIDIIDLKVACPQLADQFDRLRTELQPPSTTTVPFEAGNQVKDLNAASDELDKLVLKIREQPGFETFLLPPKKEEIMNAAKCGPIVVVNVSEYRCDALLVEEHQIRSLALPNLKFKDVKDYGLEGRLGSPRVLGWLWDAVAKPVLEALKFTQHPLDDKWPRIWWIPTGLLSKFPLHAAGYYSAGSSETVLDRVMSSYSPSVKAIIHGRRRRLHEGSPKTPDRALLVAIEHTPGYPRLPFATKEITMLRDLCKSMGFEPIEPGQSKEAILSSLPQCRIFHFAGHGNTDGSDPSQSYLLLEDGDALKVATLLDMNIRERSPFLAYLSACGTGEVKDEKFFDESIHLISACQLAGFRHVIGTLWDVNDESCVDITRLTYEGIRDGGITDESVCRGLHKATRAFRDRWRNGLAGGRGVKASIIQGSHTPMEGSKEKEVGGSDIWSRKIIPVDEDDGGDGSDGQLYWVPYVHFGV